MKVKIVDFFKNRFFNASANLPYSTWEKILEKFWYGGITSNSGIDVSTESAMKFGAVSTCVSIISSDIGMIPLELRRYRDPKNKWLGSDPAIEHPLYYVFSSKANKYMTSYNYKERVMSDVLLSGNHFSKKKLNMRGQVTELVPLDWQSMAVKQSESGEIYFVYRDPNTNQEKVYHYDEIFHFAGYGSGIVGKSPVHVKMDAIGLGLAAEDFAAKFYKQGLNAGGVITMPGKIKDKEGLRKELKEKYQGLQNANLPLVLEEGMTFTKLLMPLKEAQFIETRRFQALDIASWYRMPPKFLQDHTYSTFSNNEQQDLDYSKHTLLPWTERFENFCSCYLLTPKNIKNGLFFQFDYNTMLKPDSKTRAEINHIRRQDGVITGNEWRSMDGLNPSESPEQNQYIINGNMRDISIVNQEQSQTLPNDEGGEKNS